MRCALALALENVGRSSAARIPIMAMTASNSTKVKPFRLHLLMQIGPLRNLIVTGRQLVSMPNDPIQVSHGHRRPAQQCNDDSQISWLGQNSKGSGRWVQR